jgi:formate hydrogenlyase subunit 4
MLAFSGLIQVALAMLLAPLLLSIIHRTKAVFAGRRGQPWLQPYWELGKLLRKSAVYSHTTTRVFVVGPIASCAAALLALLFLQKQQVVQADLHAQSALFLAETLDNYLLQLKIQQAGMDREKFRKTLALALQKFPQNPELLKLGGRGR